MYLFYTNDIGKYLLIQNLTTYNYNFAPLYKIWKHLWIVYKMHLYNSAAYLDNKLQLIDLSTSEFLPLTLILTINFLLRWYFFDAFFLLSWYVAFL